MRFGKALSRKTGLMSKIERFWSFRQILEGARDTAESQQPGRAPMSPMSVPFVVGDTATTGPEVPIEYEQSDDPDFAASVQTKREKLQRNFVYPDPDQLQKMSLRDLHQLRRDLAMQVHPDRSSNLFGREQSQVMARCNQLIDDAIVKKRLSRSG